jgi:hypothetical protein
MQSSTASTLRFVPAERRRALARLALIGPSGSGKTYSALQIAAGLARELGLSRIGLIDSERGSALKHAGKGVDFVTLPLESFAPRIYVEAIRAAAEARLEVLIVDGLSQAWAGRDGALEMVDQATARSRSGNSFAAWREVTPEHNRLVDALTAAPMHLIVTMRAKTEWVLEDVDNGRGGSSKAPRKVGLAPIQRDGLEYEFDVVGDLTLAHDLLVSKSRCELFDRATIARPGRELGAQLGAWLNEGAPEPQVPAVAQPAPAAAPRPRRARAERAAGRAVDQAPEQSDARALERPVDQSTEAPAQPPSFSRLADWSGSGEWAGRPLEQAGVAPLEAYAAAVDAAIANPRNKPRLRALIKHGSSVQRALQAARAREQAAAGDSDPFGEAALEGAPGLGWDLNGSGRPGADDEAIAH